MPHWHRIVPGHGFDVYGHISNEEDGLFPASLTSLSGDEWDAAMDAWHEAHPGKLMFHE